MLVVGAVNVDLVVAAARLPMPGQTVTGGDLARYPGRNDHPAARQPQYQVSANPLLLQVMTQPHSRVFA